MASCGKADLDKIKRACEGGGGKQADGIALNNVQRSVLKLRTSTVFRAASASASCRLQRPQLELAEGAEEAETVRTEAKKSSTKVQEDEEEEEAESSFSSSPSSIARSRARSALTMAE